MSETLIPTMNFRYLTPSLTALAHQPTAKRLQQMFYANGFRPIWKDVPIVEEAASALSSGASS